MMRRVLLIALSMVALLPKAGNAQPITVNGLAYYPTSETRFFDGRIMAQVDVLQSSPVYSDVTLEPYSVVYVPISRYLVRAYERRRAGELAGTEGSRVPAFPVDIPSSSASSDQ